MGEAQTATGPDYSAGIDLDEIPREGTLAGRVGDEPVLLSRFGDKLFAVSGACTHYGGHLADGLIARASVRCPLHHACFDLRTGAALRGPAIDPLDRWLVEVDGDRAVVRTKVGTALRREPSLHRGVDRIVIVGGGAAGLACANELRELGFSGNLAILSADADPPVDRPNLSKDYLAGTAPEEWLPLRSPAWYADNRIDLRLSAEVTGIDSVSRTVRCASGERIPFDRLLIATGSEPNRLNSPGFDGDNVFTLRSAADARAISARAEHGKKAVVIGASFIGLEAAAALRHRDVEVTVASVEEVPLEHIFGKEIGKHLQGLHETNGVRFRLNSAASAFDGRRVTLAGGEMIDADFVLVGIGVRPRTAIAELAGAQVDNGVIVDAFLETTVPGIYAAGDIAAYPDPISGERIRIEHWVTAERQGQVAAANMLGASQRFEAIPFFWTEQFGVPIRYVGRARGWDTVTLEGSFESGSLIARYFAEGTHCATASIGRDRQNLEDERMLENRAQASTEIVHEPE